MCTSRSDDNPERLLNVLCAINVRPASRGDIVAVVKFRIDSLSCDITSQNR